MRLIIDRFLSRLVSKVEQLRPQRVIDLGCGEGIVAQRLQQLPYSLEYRGLELNPEAVRAAQAMNPGLTFIEANILEYEPEPGWADVALCLEVLEHLDDPVPAVARIAEWTSSLAVISVPWEPYFRTGNLMRGKYLRHFGNHPEHVQQFQPKSLKALLSREFAVVEVETCFPWLIAVAAKGVQRKP